MEPVDKVCHQLPPEKVYKQFGRASKLLIHPKDVPDIELLIPNKAINHMEDTAEINEVATRHEKVSEGQISSDTSKKSIITAAKQEGEHTSDSEQSREHTSDMDNSEKLIYSKNFTNTTEDDKSISGRPTKLSD